MALTEQEIRDRGRELEQAGATPDEIRSFMDAAFRELEAGGPSGELIAGTPEQRRTQQREAVRRELGLIEPISDQPVGLVPRAGASFARSDESARAYWEKLSGGPDRVKALGGGRFLVLMPGSQKWEPTDPAGLDIGDVTADVAGEALPAVAGFAAERAAGPITGVGRAITGSAIGAGVGNLVGAAQDVAFNKAVGVPVDLADIAVRRGISGVVETGVGAALPAVLSPVVRNNMAIEQLGGAVRANAALPAVSRQITEEGIEAAGGLERRFGEGAAPLTAGQATGNRAVQEVESAVRKSGRFVKAGQEIQEQQERLPQIVRESLTRGLDLPEAAGAVSAAIERSASLTRDFVKESFDSAAKAVEEALAKKMQQVAAGEVAPLSLTQAGARVRTAFNEKMAQMKEAEDAAYKSFRDQFAQSGTPEKFVKLEKSEALIDEILGKLLTTKRAADGKLVDAKGKPIPEEVEEVLRIYAPQRDTLTQIKEAANDEQKLEAVLNLRSFINEQVRKMGTQTNLESSVVKRLTAALTDDITRSVDEFTGNGSEALKAAWEATRTKYERFEKSPVLYNILEDAADGGFRNNAEIITYFTQGGGKYDELRAVGQVLPPREYNALRRAMVDSIMGQDSITIGNRRTADLGAMGSRMKSLSKEVKDEVFGDRKTWEGLESILDSFKDVTQNRSIFVTEGLPDAAALERVKEAIERNAVPEARALMGQAVQAARNEAKQASSEIVSKIRRGDYSGIDADPHQFLDKFFLSKDIAPAYAKRIYDMLPEPQRKNVSKALIDTMFNRALDATESPLSTAIGKNLAGTYNPEKFVKTLMGGSDNQRDAIRYVAGFDNFEAIKDMLSYQHLINYVEKRTGNVGSISRETVAGLTDVAELVKRNAIARFVFSKNGQNLLRAWARTPETVTKFVSESRSRRFLDAMASNTGTAIATIAPQAGIRQLQYEFLNATEDFTPEERQALNDWLFSRVPNESTQDTR